MSDFTTIAIMAESNHGKDFCGQWIVEHQNYCEIAFADHIKRLCNLVLEFDYASLWGDSDLRNKTKLIDWDRAQYKLTWHLDDWLFQISSLSVEEKANYKTTIHAWFNAIRNYSYKPVNDLTGQLSPRVALQLLGTEFGRSFKQNIWSSLVLDHMIPKIKRGLPYSRQFSVGGRIGESECSTKQGVIITDCRFGSELVAVQAAGGYVIKVIRTSKVGTTLVSGVTNHSSELELQNIPNEAFDLVLALEEGEDKAYPVLKSMFDGRLFELSRKIGNPLWKP